MRTLLTMITITVAVVAVPVTTGPAVAAAADDSPARQEPVPALQTNTSDLDSADEYLTTFRELEGTAAFTNYSEFEVIRSQAVLSVQVGNFTRAEQRRMELLLSLLGTFRAGYQHQQNGSYDAAIEAANETNAISDRLRQNDGEQYAILADVALERFYGQTGQALQSRAETESSTPQRIATLERAALTYQRSGSTDRYSQVLIRVDSIQKAYDADLATLNDSAAAATTFTEDCRDCGDVIAAIGTYGFGVFPRYQRSIEAEDQSRTAVELADQHGLTDQSEAMTSLRSEVDAMQATLALASLTIVLGYSAVVGLFAALVGWRLLAWRRDLRSAARGDSVLVGAMLRD